MLDRVRKGKVSGRSKLGGVISVSPYALGGFRANHHLRQALVFLDVPAMQQPEAYLGGADKFLGKDGAIVKDSTRDLLRGFMSTFAIWIEANRAVA